MGLFSKYGYKNTSVRMIASEVGVRESALYNHFKNKEEIFLNVIKDKLSSPFENESKDITQQAKKGKLFLSNIATQYKLMAFDKQSDDLFRLLIIELFSNQTLREHFLDGFHSQNVKLLSEAFFIMMQNSIIRSGDPMVFAYEFLSTMFYIRLQITLFRFDAKNPSVLSAYFEKHVDFFWDSISLA